MDFQGFKDLPHDAKTRLHRWAMTVRNAFLDAAENPHPNPQYTEIDPVSAGLIEQLAASTIMEMRDSGKQPCCMTHGIRDVATYVGLISYSAGFRMGHHGIENLDLDPEWRGTFKIPTDEEVAEDLAEAMEEMAAREDESSDLGQFLDSLGVQLEDVKDGEAAVITLSGENAEKIRGLLEQHKHGPSHQAHMQDSHGGDDEAPGLYL